MRNTHIPVPCVRLALGFALCMSLSVGVPAANAQGARNLWSIQLHGGSFAPLEANGMSPMLGMRYCKHYSPYLQAGLLTGWTFNTRRLMAPAAGPEGSGSDVELARVDARLVPVMAFLQINFTEKLFLVPLAGIGAGYEWLLVDSQDHRTGQESSTYYGSPAWEAYGGVAVPVSRGVRLNGELFYNGGSLERTVPGPSGGTWREAVHVNGVGLRLGLDMVFE